MALRYHVPLPDIENYNEDIDAVRPRVDADNLYVNERIREPRVIAERIQKQIMQERFPNFACAWERE